MNNEDQLQAGRFRRVAHVAVFALGAVALCVLSPAFSADAEPVKPLVDVLADPGCGKTGMTREQRIEHNRKLAAIYIQSYAEAPQRNKLYGWTYHNCRADNATSLAGTLDPKLANLRTRDPSVDKKEDLGAMEDIAFRKALPDWGPRVETAVIYPFDYGATFRVYWQGHAADGKEYGTWDVWTILVNDEGRITHSEFYNDTMAVDEQVRLVYGVGLKELSAPGAYKKLLTELNKERNKE